MVTGPRFEFRGAQPIESDEAAFRVRLEEATLRVEMKEHHSTAQSAQDVVDPYLRAWEIDFALKRGRREMWFEFEGPELVDRSPPAPGDPIEMGGAGVSSTTGSVTGTISACAYPMPPDRFRASDEVRALMLHFEAFVAGAERLVDAAYFTLTMLERRAGRSSARVKAAERFGIDYAVLKTVGRLTSHEVGDLRTARKVSPKSSLRPHTPAELAWLEASLRMMIRRLGEHDFDPLAVLPTITMADLPVL